MTNENKPNYMWIGIISSIIGGFIVYIILKSKQQIPVQQIQPSQFVLSEFNPLTQIETSYKNSEKWKITRT